MTAPRQPVVQNCRQVKRYIGARPPEALHVDSLRQQTFWGMAAGGCNFLPGFETFLQPPRTW